MFKKLLSKKNVRKQTNFVIQPPPPGCDHQNKATCVCVLVLNGNNAINHNYIFQVRMAYLEADMAEFCAHYRSSFPDADYNASLDHIECEMSYFRSRLQLHGNLRLLPPQTPCVSFPQPFDIDIENEEVKRLGRLADMLMWNKRGVQMPKAKFVSDIWDCPCPNTLSGQIVHQQSIYNMAFGRINGRPRAVLSTANLYPRKWANALLLQQRNVHTPVENSKYALKNVKRALDMMYFRLGVDHLRQKKEFPITFNGLIDSYLGSSAGLHNSVTKKVKFEEVEVVISPNGKKYENFENDLTQIINFLADQNVDPDCYWQIKEKVEVFFSNKHQKNDESYANWINKVRVFVIPHSLFTMMERMVSKGRMLMERRGHIRIGGKWSRGGADILAKMLGINSLNDLKRILVEGDVKNFDQSTIAFLVELYFKETLYYDIPFTKNRKLRKAIVKWIIKNIIVRITHMLGKLWAMQKGGVPSGCFNTSHMDSWVMALYFFLFAYYQIERCPDDICDELEDALIRLIFLVVYGDDHAWNKTDIANVSYWFSGVEFQKFMKDCFDVDIRELKDGIPFLSSTTGYGTLKETGLTFLKYQFVLNPHKGEGQPRYLPYRESWEFVIRALIGTKGQPRTGIDVLMSTIGHAYGTYASNRHAYDCLKAVYDASVQTLGRDYKRKMQDALRVLPDDDIRSMRRKGVTVEELLSGFPSWQCLIDKNRVDLAYHVPEYDLETADLDF